MLIVADILPQTSEVVPLISVYFTSILIEVSSYKHSLINTCRFVSFLHWHGGALVSMVSSLSSDGPG